MIVRRRRALPGARLLALALAAIFVAACERASDVPSPSPQVASSGSGSLMGRTPAAPTGNTAQTEGAPGSKELTTGEEVTAMPLPGQPNDHSNLAPNASQRAGAADPLQNPDRRQP